MFAKTAETESVETPPHVGPAQRLDQIRERRRAAEQTFNDKFAEMCLARELLAKSVRVMEQAKREFHATEQAEADELMRQRIKV